MAIVPVDSVSGVDVTVLTVLTVGVVKKVDVAVLAVETEAVVPVVVNDVLAVVWDSVVNVVGVVVVTVECIQQISRSVILSIIALLTSKRLQKCLVN